LSSEVKSGTTDRSVFPRAARELRLRAADSLAASAPKPAAEPSLRGGVLLVELPLPSSPKVAKSPEKIVILCLHDRADAL